jgi:hypothetical protein
MNLNGLTAANFDAATTTALEETILASLPATIVGATVTITSIEDIFGRRKLLFQFVFSGLEDVQVQGNKTVIGVIVHWVTTFPVNTKANGGSGVTNVTAAVNSISSALISSVASGNFTTLLVTKAAGTLSNITITVPVSSLGFGSVTIVQQHTPQPTSTPTGAPVIFIPYTTLQLFQRWSVRFFWVYVVVGVIICTCGMMACTYWERKRKHDLVMKATKLPEIGMDGWHHITHGAVTGPRDSRRDDVDDTNLEEVMIEIVDGQNDGADNHSFSSPSTAEQIKLERWLLKQRIANNRALRQKSHLPLSQFESLIDDLMSQNKELHDMQLSQLMEINKMLSGENAALEGTIRRNSGSPPRPRKPRTAESFFGDISYDYDEENDGAEDNPYARDIDRASMSDITGDHQPLELNRSRPNRKLRRADEFSSSAYLASNNISMFHKMDKFMPAYDEDIVGATRIPRGILRRLRRPKQIEGEFEFEEYDDDDDEDDFLGDNEDYVEVDGLGDVGMESIEEVLMDLADVEVNSADAENEITMDQIYYTRGASAGSRRGLSIETGMKDEDIAGLASDYIPSPTIPVYGSMRQLREVYTDQYNNSKSFYANPMRAGAVSGLGSHVNRSSSSEAATGAMEGVSSTENIETDSNNISSNNITLVRLGSNISLSRNNSSNSLERDLHRSPTLEKARWMQNPGEKQSYRLADASSQSSGSSSLARHVNRSGSNRRAYNNESTMSLSAIYASNPQNDDDFIPLAGADVLRSPEHGGSLTKPGMHVTESPQMQSHSLLASTRLQQQPQQQMVDAELSSKGPIIPNSSVIPLPRSRVGETAVPAARTRTPPRPPVAMEGLLPSDGTSLSMPRFSPSVMPNMSAGLPSWAPPSEAQSSTGASQPTPSRIGVKRNPLFRTPPARSLDASNIVGTNVFGSNSTGNTVALDMASPPYPTHVTMSTAPTSAGYPVAQSPVTTFISLQQTSPESSSSRSPSPSGSVRSTETVNNNRLRSIRNVQGGRPNPLTRAFKR